MCFLLFYRVKTVSERLKTVANVQTSKAKLRKKENQPEKEDKIICLGLPLESLESSIICSEDVFKIWITSEFYSSVCLFSKLYFD